MGVIVGYDTAGADENAMRQQGMIALGNQIGQVFSAAGNKATPRKFFRALKSFMALPNMELRYQSASIPANPAPPVRGLKIDAVARAGNLIVCTLINDTLPADQDDAGSLVLKFEREDDADKPGGDLPEYFMSVTFPAQADHTGINYFQQVATDIPAIPAPAGNTTDRQKYLAAFAFLSRCK